MRNKRGQETGTALLWWLVALVVFGLLIWGFYRFYSYGTSKIDLLPEDISVYAGTCDLYGQAGDSATSRSSYCTEFKEIKSLSSVTYYLSCQDRRVLNVVKNRVDCSGLNETQTAIDKCKALNQVAIDNGKVFDGTKYVMNQLGNCNNLTIGTVQVSGKTCSDVKGVWEPSGFNCDLHEASLDITNKVTNAKDISDHKDQICCG